MFSLSTLLPPFQTLLYVDLMNFRRFLSKVMPVLAEVSRA